MNKEKVFCIGFNKTGTTSLKVAMKELGYNIPNQRVAELLCKDWAIRDFGRLIEYCHSADFFQDIPFSLPYTFTVLDQEFSKSKFILTIRDSAEQWYNSLTRFHAKKWSREGENPTKKDLKKASYIYKGYPWHTNRLIYKSPEDEPYKKDTLIKQYVSHIESVRYYFRYRPDDLLVLNIAHDDSYQKLCDFLGVEGVRDEFPWENKTSQTPIL